MEIINVSGIARLGWIRTTLGNKRNQIADRGHRWCHRSSPNRAWFVWQVAPRQGSGIILTQDVVMRPRESTYPSHCGAFDNICRLCVWFYPINITPQSSALNFTFLVTKNKNGPGTNPWWRRAVKPLLNLFANNASSGVRASMSRPWISVKFQLDCQWAAIMPYPYYLISCIQYTSRYSSTSPPPKTRWAEVLVSVGEPMMPLTCRPSEITDVEAHHTSAIGGSDASC